MSFAENLYFLRKREGISQEELAEKLGVSRQAVSKWETGDAYPETEKILMLCDRYGVTMDVLMRGDVKTEPCEPATEKDAEPVKAAPAEEEQSVENGQLTTAQKVAQPLIWLCAAAVYIILGAVWNLWHPAWILFVITAAVAAVVNLILSPKEKRQREIGGTIDFAVIMATAVTYLLCGFYAGLWHPMWVVFLLIPVTCTITGIVFPNNKKD